MGQIYFRTPKCCLLSIEHFKNTVVAVSYAAPTMLKMSFTFKVPVDTAKSVGVTSYKGKKKKIGHSYIRS